jgi:hypothetical protein
MIRTAIAIVALALLTATAVAEQGKTFHDSMGREVGRSERHGDTTIYLDAMGRRTGRSERRGGETIFFNERGGRVGTERERSSGGR